MIHQAKHILLQLHSRLFNRFEIEYLANKTPKSQDLDIAKLKQMLKLYKGAGIFGISFNFEISLLGLASSNPEQREQLILKYQEVVETSQRHLGPDQPLKHSAHNKDNAPIQARKLFVDLLKCSPLSGSQEKDTADVIPISAFEKDHDKLLLQSLEHAIFDDVKRDLNIPNDFPEQAVQKNRLKEWLEFQSSELRSAQGESIFYTLFSPISVNLLELIRDSSFSRYWESESGLQTPLYLEYLEDYSAPISNTRTDQMNL